MFILFLIFSCVRLLTAIGLNFPSYIPKCSLSDPFVSQCILKTANAVIPTIIKGKYCKSTKKRLTKKILCKSFDSSTSGYTSDNNLAISCISPLNISEISIKGDNLDMQWYNMYTEDLKNYRLTNVSFLLAPNTLSYYEGFINQFTIRGSNYNIFSGKILGIPAYGSGNFNITLVGVTIKIFPQLTTYLNDGLIYLNVPLGPIQTNVTRAYYYFENIQSPTNDDVNAYIENNWEEFTRQIIPALNTQFSVFINYPTSIITSKIPLNLIFLP